MLRGDEGRVPFSLVAVVALLLAGVSSVVVSTTDREAAQNRLEVEQVRALEAVARAVHEGVLLEARGLALEAIRSASSGPLDPRRVNGLFAQLVHERLVPSFPREARGLAVELEDVRAGLLLESFSTMDAVPSGAVTQESSMGAPVDAIDTARPATFGETLRTPYFRVVGAANYTVRRGELLARVTLPLSETVDSPFPLLQSAGAEFAASAQGSEAELARLVRYILTTAAQFRALQGFAAGAYGEPGTGTRDVLSAEDVEVAVNLALLLEELRRFRAVDPRSPAALDARHFGEGAGLYLDRIPEFADRAMGRLLEDFAAGGTADPADLFALYRGFDADPLRLNRVLAQALSAVIDQAVLRVLEYFGFDRHVDLCLAVAETLARDIEGFLAWVTGESREARLARGFVTELFGMAGEAATVLGPYPATLPAAGAYAVTNGDGAVVNISIPAHPATIAFDRIEFLAGRDALWKGYYAARFADDLRAVHSSARDFLTDFASQVADGLHLIGSIPNPALRGAIDPKDGESLLEFVQGSLDAGIAGALERLRSDPGYLDGLAANLWAAQADAVRDLVMFLEEAYDELASKDAQIEGARARLAADLEARSVSDPDYPRLDATGRAALREAIRRDVDRQPWVPDAYAGAKERDLARFERVYAVATDPATPPEAGGIRRWLEDTVTGATGVLAQAGDAIAAYGRALAEGDDLHNAKVLLQTPQAPFEFWSGDRAAAQAAGAVRREALVVRQTPASLQTGRLGGSDAWDRRDLEVGDLWTDVRDPALYAGSATPNVHYTNLTSVTARPFETRWEVRIAGLVRVDVSTARGVHVGPDGHLPDTASEVVRIDLALSVTVFTGWPLAGVEYADTDSFAADAWAFLARVLEPAWRLLQPVVDWVVDLVHQAVEYIGDLIRRVMTSDVVQALYNVTSTVVGLLQNATLRALAAESDVLEKLARDLQGGNRTWEIAGMRISVTGSVTGGNLTLNAWRDGLEVHAAVVLGLAGWNPLEPVSVDNSPLDLLYWGTCEVGDTTLHVAGDALTALKGTFATVRALPKAGGWALEMAVPELDASTLKTPWEAELPPIPTPIGTLTLSFGVEIRYTTHTTVEWLRMLGDALLEAWSEAGSLSSLEDAGRLLRIFLRHLVEELLDTLLHVIEVEELLFYVEGVVGATATGAGFRVAFVVDGMFIERILRWIIDNIMAFLDGLGAPQPGVDADYGAFPSDLLDFLGLRFEVFLTAGLPACLSGLLPEGAPDRVRVAFRVQPNLPAIANYWDPGMGTWRVDFGAYLEQVPSPIPEVLFRTDGPADVYFIRGAVYEVPPGR